MPGKPVIFVSCGQYAENEKRLGKLVVEIVVRSGQFDAYFAENQTSLNTLTENILRQLSTCVALIAIMHKRGDIETPQGLRTRASVWIEQEIAIAAFIRQVLRRDIDVLLFMQDGISLEGIREQLHLNPIRFHSDEDVLEYLRTHLQGWTSRISEGMRQKPLVDVVSAADGQTDPRIEEVDLSLSILNGRSENFAITVTNDSELDIEIKKVQLRYENTDITQPGKPPSGSTWLVGAGNPLAIGWRATPSPAMRIVSLREDQSPGIKQHGWFNTTMQFRFYCRILGSSRTIDKDKFVMVDRVNNIINEA